MSKLWMDLDGRWSSYLNPFSKTENLVVKEVDIYPLKSSKYHKCSKYKCYSWDTFTGTSWYCTPLNIKMSPYFNSKYIIPRQHVFTRSHDPVLGTIDGPSVVYQTTKEDLDVCVIGSTSLIFSSHRTLIFFFRRPQRPYLYYLYVPLQVRL